jgi:hypothetical protein
LPGLRLLRKGKAELPDSFRAAFDIAAVVPSPSVFTNCFQHVLDGAAVPLLNDVDTAKAAGQDIKSHAEPPGNRHGLAHLASAARQLHPERSTQQFRVSA